MLCFFHVVRTPAATNLSAAATTNTNACKNLLLNPVHFFAWHSWQQRQAAVWVQPRLLCPYLAIAPSKSHPSKRDTPILIQCLWDFQQHLWTYSHQHRNPTFHCQSPSPTLNVHHHHGAVTTWRHGMMTRAQEREGGRPHIGLFLQNYIDTGCY